MALSRVSQGGVFARKEKCNYEASEGGHLMTLIKCDQRVAPMAPYRLYAVMEVASQTLGGKTNVN